MANSEDKGSIDRATHPSVEKFLQAVEKKTADPVHHRLLRAARSSDLISSLEGELNAVILAIIHAN